MALAMHIMAEMYFFIHAQAGIHVEMHSKGFATDEAAAKELARQVLMVLPPHLLTAKRLNQLALVGADRREEAAKCHICDIGQISVVRQPHREDRSEPMIPTVISVGSVEQDGTIGSFSGDQTSMLIIEGEFCFPAPKEGTAPHSPPPVGRNLLPDRTRSTIVPQRESYI